MCMSNVAAWFIHAELKPSAVEHVRHQVDLPSAGSQTGCVMTCEMLLNKIRYLRNDSLHDVW